MPQKKHVFVCLQNRPAGDQRGSCQAKGSARVYQAFVDEFNKRAIWDDFRLTTAGCLGMCSLGASVLVYPDGVVYGRVTKDDVGLIIDNHLIAGEPVERLTVAKW